MRRQPVFPPFQAEGAAVKYAVVLINRGNQVVLNVAPILPQQRQRHGVDWYAVPLNQRSGLHETSTQQRPR